MHSCSVFALFFFQCSEAHFIAPVPICCLLPPVPVSQCSNSMLNDQNTCLMLDPSAYSALCTIHPSSPFPMCSWKVGGILIIQVKALSSLPCTFKCFQFHPYLQSLLASTHPKYQTNKTKQRQKKPLKWKRLPLQQTCTQPLKCPFCLFLSRRVQLYDMVSRDWEWERIIFESYVLVFVLEAFLFLILVFMTTL